MKTIAASSRSCPSRAAAFTSSAPSCYLLFRACSFRSTGTSPTSGRIWGPGWPGFISLAFASFRMWDSICCLCIFLCFLFAPYLQIHLRLTDSLHLQIRVRLTDSGRFFLAMAFLCRGSHFLCFPLSLLLVSWLLRYFPHRTCYPPLPHWLAGPADPWPSHRFRPIFSRHGLSLPWIWLRYHFGWPGIWFLSFSFFPPLPVGPWCDSVVGMAFLFLFVPFPCLHLIFRLLLTSSGSFGVRCWNVAIFCFLDPCLLYLLDFVFFRFFVCPASFSIRSWSSTEFCFFFDSCSWCLLFLLDFLFFWALHSPCSFCFIRSWSFAALCFFSGSSYLFWLDFPFFFWSSFFVWDIFFGFLFILLVLLVLDLRLLFIPTLVYFRLMCLSSFCSWFYVVMLFPICFLLLCSYLCSSLISVFCFYLCFQGELLCPCSSSGTMARSTAARPHLHLLRWRMARRVQVSFFTFNIFISSSYLSLSQRKSRNLQTSSLDGISVRVSHAWESIPYTKVASVSQSN